MQYHVAEEFTLPHWKLQPFLDKRENSKAEHKLILTQTNFWVIFESSPDLNPVEHLWDDSGEQVADQGWPVADNMGWNWLNVRLSPSPKNGEQDGSSS